MGGRGGGGGGQDGGGRGEGGGGGRTTHACGGAGQIDISIFCPCLKTLCEARFNSNILINLTEEISRQPSIQFVALIYLAVFSQVYRENWEQKLRVERFEKLTAWSEKSM